MHFVEEQEEEQDEEEKNSDYKILWKGKKRQLQHLKYTLTNTHTTLQLYIL